MDFLENAQRLPVIDWNLTFFGAHEQSVPAGWTVPPEKHYAFEVIYVLSGAEHLRLGGSTSVMQAGGLILIPPEFSHQVWAEEPLRYFCFHFDIDDPAFKLKLIENLTNLYPSTSPLCRQLAPYLLQMDGLIAPHAQYTLDTKLSLQILLTRFLQVLNDSTTTSEGAASLTQGEYARVIADYLKNRLTEQILNYTKHRAALETELSIEDAIQQAGLSLGYGTRVFKQTYGVPPRTYLSKIKINEAKKLLQKPQFTITEVAAALGYRNMANFSRQFKRWTKQSPLTFRQQQHRQ